MWTALLDATFLTYWLCHRKQEHALSLCIYNDYESTSFIMHVNNCMQCHVLRLFVGYNSEEMMSSYELKCKFDIWYAFSRYYK